MKRWGCCLSVVISQVSLWLCAGLILFGGGSLVRRAGLELAGFRQVGSVEAYWSAQPTPIQPPPSVNLENFQPVATALPATAIPVPTSTPRNAEEYHLQQAQLATASGGGVVVAPPRQAIQAAPVIQGSDDRFNEFLEMGRTNSGQPMLLYRAGETDFKRLCEFVACEGDLYRYSSIDLRPQGAIIYGEVRLEGLWQALGILVRVDDNNHLQVGGVVMDGMVYALPNDPTLRKQLDGALEQLNENIDEHQIYVDGQPVQLTMIQVSDDEVQVVFR